MNANGEFTKDDLMVDHDMQIDCDIGQEILVYFECWFDADRKFGIDTSENDAWLNMYGRYISKTGLKKNRIPISAS